LVECNKKNKDRLDRFGNVKPDAGKEMWLRYIFSREPSGANLKAFETSGWNNPDNLEECKLREIQYFNDFWLLVTQ
jgi:hypothetical protein